MPSNAIELATDRDADWLTRWLEAGRDGEATMSQRARSSIDAHGVIDNAVTVARAMDVHLLAVTDDKGRVLVAASREPFRTPC